MCRVDTAYFLPGCVSRGISALSDTGCNIVKYTNLKIYCDKTNCDITTPVVTERFSTLQVLRHLKPSTRGHHWLVRCSPSKWRNLLTWKKAKCVLQLQQNHSATLVLFGTNYGRQAPTRKSIYKWHKSFAETGCICANKKN
jgi:hypothetical protein